mmetsp:Transcript_1768/g.6970  ORF Transcript_1768/g.6970 Transcript_1768/m.6970 type:complete len:106 (-) Transcript_1768:166-483(-)
MSVVRCDGSNFAMELEKADSKIVVINFVAEWTPPCKEIAPYFRTLAESDQDICCLEVDVDACEELADKYQVEAMPTFVFLKLKEKLGSYTGANINKVKEKLAELK